MSGAKIVRSSRSVLEARMMGREGVGVCEGFGGEEGEGGGAMRMGSRTEAGMAGKGERPGVLVLALVEADAHAGKGGLADVEGAGMSETAPVLLTLVVVAVGVAVDKGKDGGAVVLDDEGADVKGVGCSSLTPCGAAPEPCAIPPPTLTFGAWLTFVLSGSGVDVRGGGNGPPLTLRLNGESSGTAFFPVPFPFAFVVAVVVELLGAVVGVEVEAEAARARFAWRLTSCSSNACSCASSIAQSAPLPFSSFPRASFLNPGLDDKLCLTELYQHEYN